MTKTERPMLGDVENPVAENDLKARLRSIGRDIGFGSKDDAVQEAPLPSRPSPEQPMMNRMSATGNRIDMDTLQIKVPRYLMQQLARTAVERRVTKKFLILETLRTCGYHIKAEDLQEDGRRDRK